MSEPFKKALVPGKRELLLLDGVLREKWSAEEVGGVSLPVDLKRLVALHFDVSSKGILLCGLKGSGKTTVLKALTSERGYSQGDTEGLVEISGDIWPVFDVGSNWCHWLTRASAIVFVFFGRRKEPQTEAVAELKRIVDATRSRDLPLLVLNNKYALELNSLRNVHWFIQYTVATEGEGIDDAFKWLTCVMK